MTDTSKRPVSPVNGQPLPRGKPFEPGERAREIGRNGGRNSQKKAKERKTLREDLLTLLKEEISAIQCVKVYRTSSVDLLYVMKFNIRQA